MLPRSAAASHGKSVLQVDASAHYGAQWSTLSARQLLESGHASSEISAALLAEQGGYALDLAPRILYGAGPMVDALLASGGHHCTEFKLLQSW